MTLKYQVLIQFFLRANQTDVIVLNLFERLFIGKI